MNLGGETSAESSRLIDARLVSETSSECDLQGRHRRLRREAGSDGIAEAPHASAEVRCRHPPGTRWECV